MAYADPIRNANVTWETVASLLDQLCGSPTARFATGLISTGSTSLGLYTGLSETVITTGGESVLCLGSIQVSHNAASGAGVYAEILFDGVAISNLNNPWVNYRSDANGADGQINLSAIALLPGSGSHTVALHWKTSGTTAYSSRGSLHTLRFRHQ